MDVFVSRPVTPQWFEGAVNQQLPAGIKVLQVYQIPPVLRSLQSQVRFADYDVTVATGKSRQDIEAAIKDLLSLSSLPWQHQRDTGVKKYDLRLLIGNIKLIEWRTGFCILGMRLRCDNTGSGRPEQVTAALGFADRPVSVHRTALLLEKAHEVSGKS